MATQVQFRGGTTSEHSTFTGAAREVTVDTTKKTVVVHDGSTVGGIPLAKESAVTSAAAITGGSINGTTVGASTASTGAFTTLSASSTVSGTGFSTYLASPPAIGGTTASTGRFTTVTATGLTSGRVTYATTAGLLTDSANLLYSGGDLTIYGITAGRGNGGGASNTVFGANALTANSSGNTNTAFGSDALRNTNTGYANAAFGGNTLTANTSGFFNCALGTSSLNANTSGANNTAAGYQALFSNTTASNNTAIGHQAGYNATGASNTNIGRSAGYSLSTGYGNTFVGTYAGSNVSTGVMNTFIGPTDSGNTTASGAAVTTGSKNTIIGGYSGNQGGLNIATASNYIVLSDGDGNPLISTNSTSSVALNGAVPQTGTGITFPAAQNASSNANTLDDYEEGTFTPILGTSNGGTATMSVQEGKYVKVGKIVQFSLQIVWTAKNTWEFNTRISGLPFTATSNTAGYVWANACQMDANVLTAPFTYGIESNSTYGYIQAINVTGAQLTESSFPSSGRVLVNGCYQTP